MGTETSTYGPKIMGMSVLAKLRGLNARRCEEAFNHGVEGWNVAEWGCAIAGEAGELCNLLKKIRRGEEISLIDVAGEVADVVIYLDLLCTKLDIDMETAIVKKFNEVTDRVGWDGPYLEE